MAEVLPGRCWLLQGLPYMRELCKRYKVVTKDMLLPSLFARYDLLTHR